VTAWPWTINAAGKGQFFEQPDAAARAVRALLDSGVRSIDVGCFQISLLWHPLAFGSLEQGFDPAANARYAARFLLTLYARTGSWEAAVEAYHSADPALGFAYRQQVFSTWSGAPSIAALAAVPVRTEAMAAVGGSALMAAQVVPGVGAAAAVPLIVAGVRIWTPAPVGDGARVVAMPPPPAEPARSPTTTATASPASAQPLPTVSYRLMPPGVMPRR
jgi:hypothetical protein